MDEDRSSRRWHLAVWAGAAATCAYFLLPPGGGAQAAVYLLLLLAAAGGLAARLVRARDELPWMWWLLLAGVLLYTLATVVWYLVPVGLGRALPFPSWVDLAYFTAYGCFSGFLIASVGRRSREADLDWRPVALIDAGVVAIAAFSVLWALLYAPALPRGGADLPLATLVTAVGYPVWAALLFGIVVRLAGSLRRTVPGLLLVAWVGGELAGNVLYGLTSALGTFTFGHPMFLGWLVSYTAVLALALHPAMGAVTAAPPRPVLGPWRRMWPLVLASATPLVLAIALPDVGSTPVMILVAMSLALLLVRTRLISGDLAEQQRLAEELKEVSAELRHRAFHDPLTGLGNRALFMHRLEHESRRRPRGGDVVSAVLLLDLDGFKSVNDTLGHAVGDRLLVEVGNRLQRSVRPADTVARLGGDEFAVLVPDLTTTEVLRLADRVLEELRRPVDVESRALPVRASIGVKRIRPDADPLRILRNADLAMYAAKERGGDRYELFADALARGYIERHELELDLRRAAQRGELRLHYQTVVDLRSRAVVGVEALVRWEHPRRGLLQPGAFIDVAERSGAIVEVDRWVVAEACRQLEAWQGLGLLPAGFHIAVNLSRRHLLDPMVVEGLRETVAGTGVHAQQLVLEVTETALSADTDLLIERLGELRHLGFTIAMDDFGTGYSSLDQLRRLPVDLLKIDRAFVADIEQGRESFALATAIVKLAASLGKRTLAEGVETAGQMAHLRALRIGMAQGYLFTRPVPADQVAEQFAAAGRSGVERQPGRT